MAPSRSRAPLVIGILAGVACLAAVFTDQPDAAGLSDTELITRISGAVAAA